MWPVGACDKEEKTSGADRILTKNISVKFNNFLFKATLFILYFPNEEILFNAGDLGSIPGLRRSPGEGKGYPLQYSGLENSVDYPWDHKESDTTEQTFTFSARKR